MQTLRGIPKRLLWDLLWDHSQLGLAIIATDWNIITCNGEFGQILGYSPTELVGVHVSSLTHPDDAMKGIKTAESEDHVDTTKQYITKSGTAIWCHLTSYPIRDEQGEVVGWLSQIRELDQGTNMENILQSIERDREEIDEIKRRLDTYMARSDKTTIHVGDDVGGDKTGRDKTTNSQRAIIVMAIMLAFAVSYIAYTMAVGNNAEPPNLPAVERKE